MERNDSEILNDNLFYSDNHVSNYEEAACCNNALITAILQGNGANIINYFNNLCFSSDPLDYEAQIIKDPKQKLKTPMCSHNKNRSNNSNNFITDNNNIIDNYINNNFNLNNDLNNNNNNNINHNNNNNSNDNNNNNNNNNDNNGNDNNNNNNNNQPNLNRSNISEPNPSNDSAAEPIMSIRKYESFNNQSKNKKRDIPRNRTNLFNAISDVFKDFFNEKSDDENEEKKNNNREKKLELKNRPILKRVIEKDILSSFSKKNSFQSQNNNEIKHANSHMIRTPELFDDDILSFNIEENQDEDISKLVSFIPIFTVKKKNKFKEGNHICDICRTYFLFGEKKTTLSCMHSFHYNCIERWIKNQKYCPVCKFNIS